MPLRTLVALALSMCSTPTIDLGAAPAVACHDQVGARPCDDVLAMFVEHRDWAERLRLVPLSGGPGQAFPVPPSMSVEALHTSSGAQFVIAREGRSAKKHLLYVDRVSEQLTPWFRFDTDLKHGPWTIDRARVAVVVQDVKQRLSALMANDLATGTLVPLHTFPWLEADFPPDDVSFLGESAVYSTYAPGIGATHLWSVPLDGSRPPIRLDLDVPTRGPVREWTIAGDHVVYTTAWDTTYATTVDGEDATSTHRAESTLGPIHDIAASADGRHVVVSGGQPSMRLLEARSRDGGDAVVLARSTPDERLNYMHPVVTATDRVLYATWHQGPASSLTETSRLWSAPLSGGQAVALTDAWPFGPGELRKISVSPGGTHVALVGRSPLVPGDTLYGGPTDGSAAVVSFAGSLDGGWSTWSEVTWLDAHRAVVKRQGEGLADLHVVDAADPSASYALTTRTATQGGRYDLAVLPDHTSAVLFAGNLRNAAQTEVFVVPWDASAPPAPLLPGEPPPDDVSHLTLLYDGE